MLASLDNEVIFKKVFTDKFIFKHFVNDILGIDFKVHKIETEKKFSPKIGKVDFSYDIFAESKDHRTIVEMQKIEYDYHFDRFLHYHMMAIAELQTNAKTYKTDKTVYTIIILTAPYTVKTKQGIPIKDEVLISSVDPRNLQDNVKKVYGHQLIFLNPEHKNPDTPERYRNWLDLIYESIHHPKNYRLNQQHKAVMKAVELINWDNLNPVTLRQMKEVEGKKQALEYYRNQILEGEQVKLDKALEKAEQEKQKAEQERQRAEKEKQKAEKEKDRADLAEKSTRIEVAKKLLDNQMPINVIAEATGLTAKEIGKIK